MRLLDPNSSPVLTTGPITMHRLAGPAVAGADARPYEVSERTRPPQCSSGALDATEVVASGLKARGLTALDSFEGRYLEAAAARLATRHGVPVDEDAIQRHTDRWNAVAQPLQRDIREALRHVPATAIVRKAVGICELHPALHQRPSGSLIARTTGALANAFATSKASAAESVPDCAARVVVPVTWTRSTFGGSTALLACIESDKPACLAQGVASAESLDGFVDELLRRAQERVRTALKGLGFAQRCYRAMASTRARDATVDAYIRSVASDDAPDAGALLDRRLRAWLDGPSIALQDQREAAQPREVRAGPSSESSNSDAGPEHHPRERRRQPGRPR